MTSEQDGWYGNSVIDYISLLPLAHFCQSAVLHSSFLLFTHLAAIKNAKYQAPFTFWLLVSYLAINNYSIDSSRELHTHTER